MSRIPTTQKTALPLTTALCQGTLGNQRATLQRNGFAKAPKRFMKGNEAIAFALIAGGVRCYFGYPITPQNEIPETLAVELPKVGGTFVQAESELAASNMLLGAVASGIRACVSSASPGISLMQKPFPTWRAASFPVLSLT